MAMCLNRSIDLPEFDDNDTHRVKIQPSNSNRKYICLLNENGERKITVQSSNSTDEIEWDLNNLEENYKRSSLNIDGYYLSANDDNSVVPKKPATDGSYFVLGRNRDHQYYYMYLPKKDTSGQEKEENESLNNNEIGQEEFGAGELELDVKESTTASDIDDSLPPVGSVRISPADANGTYICLFKEDDNYVIKIKSTNLENEINWYMDHMWKKGKYVKSSLKIDDYYFSTNSGGSVVPTKTRSYVLLGKGKNQNAFNIYRGDGKCSCNRLILCNDGQNLKFVKKEEMKNKSLNFHWDIFFD